MPSVETPSRIAGLYLPGRQAALNSRTVRARPSASMPSSAASASSVGASALVTCLMRYSSRTMPMVLASKICTAVRLGCFITSRPYRA